MIFASLAMFAEPSSTLPKSACCSCHAQEGNDCASLEWSVHLHLTTHAASAPAITLYEDLLVAVSIRGMTSQPSELGLRVS